MTDKIPSQMSVTIYCDGNLSVTICDGPVTIKIVINEIATDDFLSQFGLFPVVMECSMFLALDRSPLAVKAVKCDDDV